MSKKDGFHFHDNLRSYNLNNLVAKSRCARAGLNPVCGVEAPNLEPNLQPPAGDKIRPDDEHANSGQGDDQGGDVKGLAQSECFDD